MLTWSGEILFKIREPISSLTLLAVYLLTWPLNTEWIYFICTLVQKMISLSFSAHKGMTTSLSSRLSVGAARGPTVGGNPAWNPQKISGSIWKAQTTTQTGQCEPSVCTNTMSSSDCAKLLWASADPRAQSSLSFTTSCNSPVVLLAIVISCCFKSHFGSQGLSSHPSADASKAPPSYYNPTCGPFTHIRGRQSSRWQKVAQSFRTTSLSASWTGQPASD